MPMALGATGIDTLAPLRSAAQARHVGLRARLIEEHQAGGIKAQLQAAPPLAFARYVRAVLLTGSERLFLYVSPMSSST